jgi:predicted O-methyltransferase YrrM
MKPPKKVECPVVRLMRVTPAQQDGLRDLVAWADPRPGAVMVEVGSYAGESAALFARSARFKSIICVDIWNNPTTRLAERYFDLRARHYPLSKWKMSSDVAAEAFEDRSLDLVYIDTWHDYDAVTRDINAWREKVRPGGVLAGHDYALIENERPDPGVEPSRFWPDVVRAVNDAFGEPHRTFQDDSWAVRL